MWQIGGFAPILGRVHPFLGVQDPVDQRYGLARFSAETRRLYGVLDRRLGTVEHVAGKLSVVDFAILGWVWRHERHQVDLTTFPQVSRWYKSLMARSGVQRGFTVGLC